MLQIGKGRNPRFLIPCSDGLLWKHPFQKLTLSLMTSHWKSPSASQQQLYPSRSSQPLFPISFCHWVWHRWVAATIHCSGRRAAPHQGQLSGAISLQLGQLRPAASRSAVQQLSCLAKIRSPVFAIFSARVFSSPMAIWVEVSDLQWKIRTHVEYLYVDSATGNVHFHSAARNLNPVVNDKHPQHLLL